MDGIGVSIVAAIGSYMFISYEVQMRVLLCGLPILPGEQGETDVVAAGAACSTLLGAGLAATETAMKATRAI